MLFRCHCFPTSLWSSQYQLPCLVRYWAQQQALQGSSGVPAQMPPQMMMPSGRADRAVMVGMLSTLVSLGCLVMEYQHGCRVSPISILCMIEYLLVYIVYKMHLSILILLYMHFVQTQIQLIWWFDGIKCWADGFVIDDVVGWFRLFCFDLASLVWLFGFVDVVL